MLVTGKFNSAWSYSLLKLLSWVFHRISVLCECVYAGEHVVYKKEQRRLQEKILSPVSPNVSAGDSRVPGSLMHLCRKDDTGHTRVAQVHGEAKGASL